MAPLVSAASSGGIGSYTMIHPNNEFVGEGFYMDVDVSTTADGNIEESVKNNNGNCDKEESVKPHGFRRAKTLDLVENCDEPILPISRTTDDFHLCVEKYKLSKFKELSALAL